MVQLVALVKVVTVVTLEMMDPRDPKDYPYVTIIITFYDDIADDNNITIAETQY